MTRYWNSQLRSTTTSPDGKIELDFSVSDSGRPQYHVRYPGATTILPFTRILGGPIDYTPGIFDLTFDQYRGEERVHSTLAN